MRPHQIAAPLSIGVGWWTLLAYMAGVSPGIVYTKPVTAVLLVLAGLGAWHLPSAANMDSNPRNRAIVSTTTGIMLSLFLIGAYTILVSNMPFLVIFWPGMPSPAAWGAIGASALVLSVSQCLPPSRWSWWFLWCGLAQIYIGCTAILGHLINEPLLHTHGMSVATALAVVGLGMAHVLLSTDRQVFKRRNGVLA